MPEPLRRSPLTRAFRDPIVPAVVTVRETPTVSFADLVRMMAEGISDAQAELDRSAAELVAELASTRVEVIPRVTETIDAQGNVTYSSAEPISRSLLELGITPTFYAFAESTVEVTMDLEIVETVDEKVEGKRRFGLFAGTAAVRTERKLNRNVSTASKLTARLVPVPSPLRIEPVRETVREAEDS